METLNITKSKWERNGTSIDAYGFGKVAIVLLPNNGGCINAIDNAILIADAGTTYNKTPILPSELLKINEELVEALKGMVWLWDEIIKALPTVKDEVKYLEAKQLIQKLTK